MVILNKTRSTLIIFTLLSLSAYTWLQPPHVGNTLIFTGGPIITVSPNHGTVEAILVHHGRIAAIGALSTLKSQAPDADMIDLKGNALLPGLIEPHTHPLATAMLGATIDVSGFKNNTRAAAIESLKQGISEGSTNGWFLAFGWDPVMVPDLTAPTLAELDSLSPDMPFVILTQMMHDAYANSAALKAASITANTANPKGGEYVKDKRGELTGTIREISAIGTLLSAMPPPPTGAFELLLDHQYKKYAKAGYTTLGILGPVGRAADPIGIIKTVGNTSNSPVRTLIYGLPDQISDTEKPEGNTDQTPLIGVKFWMDGSPFAGGAAFADPYENSALVTERLHLQKDHTGALNYSSNSFVKTFTAYHKRGFQIAMHAQGERAIDLALDAVEATLLKYPRSDHRHRLEHNALITKSQLTRAANLGMTTSFFIDHLYYYGHALPDLVGDRIARYMPIKNAIAAGHRVSLHSDNPASPINAFRVMQTARSRMARQGGELLAPDQRLTPEEALKAMTIDAAWQLGIEKETGSIDIGKSADFTIVTHNPLTTDDSDLQKIEITGSWLKGQPVDTRTVTPTSIRFVWGILKAKFSGS